MLEIDPKAQDHLLERAHRFEEYAQAWAGRWALALNAGNAVALLATCDALLTTARAPDGEMALVVILVTAAVGFAVGLAGSLAGLRARWRLALAVRDRLYMRAGVKGLIPTEARKAIDATVEAKKRRSRLWNVVAVGGFLFGISTGVAGLAYLSSI